MVKSLGALFLCLALISIAAQAEAKRMVCYFGSWSVYRPGDGKFDVENINPFLCTHLIFGFVGLSEEPGIKVLDPWNELYDDYGKGAFSRFVNLRNQNPALKTLVAIGGWNEGSVRYSEAMSTAAKRSIFVQNALAFVQKYNFDGLDLDWEYPAQRGGAESDKENYTELLKALRTEFDKHGLLLTAAVAAAESSMSLSYDVPALAQYLDFINVMTYDMHGAWEKVTGHNAPLYGAADEVGGEFEGFNIDASIQTWLRYGAPADKLVMGVGMYGRSFTLASSACTVARCPNTGGGWAGQWTRETGILGYNEICRMETQTGTTLHWDDEAQVPYLISGNQWVGYDNKRSTQLKIDYILNNNLGGAMIWSVDTEDYSGACGQGAYPLLSLLKSGMTNGVVSETTTTAATTTAATTTAATTTEAATTEAATTEAATTEAATTEAATTAATTTAAPEAEVTTISSCKSTPCTRTGYIRDPSNCQIFYQCSYSKSCYSYSTFTCSGNLVFDTELNVCNFPESVVC